MYDLRALFNATDKVCRMAQDAPETFEGEAINFINLGCIDVKFCVSMDGSERYIVYVDEASPNAVGLQSFISEELAIRGFKNIQVITEW